MPAGSTGLTDVTEPPPRPTMSAVIVHERSGGGTVKSINTVGNPDASTTSASSGPDGGAASTTTNGIVINNAPASMDDSAEFEWGPH